VFFFQEWWSSLSERSQVLTKCFLKSALRTVPDIGENDLDPIVNTILSNHPLIVTQEQDRLLEDFVVRCVPFFDLLDEVFSDGQPLASVIAKIEKELQNNIELKACILGMILKESNDLVFLADLALKLVQNAFVDHAKDIDKLIAEEKSLAARIEEWHSLGQTKSEFLWEWEVNLEGCPNLDCQYINPPGVDTCQQCGISLIGECPDCYNEIPVTSQYCRVCGKKDLEEWNLLTRFNLSLRMAFEQKLYTKAYNLFDNLPAELRQYPEIIALHQQLEAMAQPQESVSDYQQKVAEEMEVVRRKWIDKIAEILAEKHPDFVLAARALGVMPAYLATDEVSKLSQRIEAERQKVVQQGRTRKRGLLWQRIELLQQKKEYQEAIQEIEKWSPTFSDAQLLAKKEELVRQSAEWEKVRRLQEGPAWACPSDFQKQAAVQYNLPVVREFDLGNGVSLPFILIPAGTFMMGSNEGYEQEQPRHKVGIRQPFYLLVHPLTQAQWRMIQGNNPARFHGEQRPVEYVSWEDCGAFLINLAKKFGEFFRLPTEAEWEYACRAGVDSPYSFGEDVTQLDEYAWFKSNSLGETHDVLGKKPNPWGLYDMYGNVWQWCQDCYDESYYKKSPAQDPMGPLGQKNSARVCRGGSYNSIASDLRCSARQGNFPSSRHAYVGLRPVLVPKKSK
jgi:formylglycine-generating enzyme required for sulfatase activity